MQRGLEMNRLSRETVLGHVAMLGSAAALGATAALVAAAALGTLLLPAWVAAAAPHNDPLRSVQILREGGCGGILPAAAALQPNALLDRAAQQWAAGRTLGEATERSGYAAESASGLHTTGPESMIVQQLRRTSCVTIANRSLREIGIYRRGSDTWFVLAKNYAVPTSVQAPVLAARALELVNAARARGARCGERSFAPAPPVSLSDTLGGVALGHASDMAVHNYFEHEDLSGHTPADRVRAVGYPEKLVGENIAFGPRTAEEVVQGWLGSPGHCENIMDPRFAEMGIAYAPGHAKRGLYWVQLLAAPRV
jgi:uncharacterized protein YkwD